MRQIFGTVEEEYIDAEEEEIERLNTLTKKEWREEMVKIITIKNTLEILMDYEWVTGVLKREMVKIDAALIKLVRLV